MNVDSGPGPIVVCRVPTNLTLEASAESQPAQSWQDKVYFRAREQEERAAAKSATSTFSRGIHQELAQLYGTLARQPDERQMRARCILAVMPSAQPKRGPMMRSLAQDAATCRLMASEFTGRPEQPFLLKLARAFEELAMITDTAEFRNAGVRR